MYRFGGTAAGAAAARAWWDEQVEVGRSVTEQDRLLYSLCQPERLLELARRYTVFEGARAKSPVTSSILPCVRFSNGSRILVLMERARVVWFGIHREAESRSLW